MTVRSLLLAIIFVFLLNTVFGQAPTAASDCDTAEINTTLAISAPGLLANDTDPDGDPLTVISFFVNGTTFAPGDTANFAQGSIRVFANGGYIFIPTPGYTGAVPLVTYTVSDGLLEVMSNLTLTVQNTTDLIEFTNLSSCNQGFGTDGNYNIQYSLSFRNRSTALDYDINNLISNINLTLDLDAVYGTGCVVEITDESITTTSASNCIDGSYPEEFDANSLNPDFLDGTSGTLFTNTSINSAILYPRQTVNISFCVVVNPFCGGRPNPTPSGSDIDFNAIFNITSSIGSDSTALNLEDFHTTEAIITAGLYVPDIDPDENPDGTYDYTNRVIISNEGTGTANNINFNMGLGSFLDNIVFNTLTVSQVPGSGPTVLINPTYNGNTDTKLLAPNNSLAPGETIILEIFHIVAPTNSTTSYAFNAFNESQTQGNLDGFNEDTPANRRLYSYVLWEDSLGNHLDRYYISNSETDVPTNDQCVCITRSMFFSFDSSSSLTKTIISQNDAPNGILEHQELTFQFVLTNESDIVEIRNLQLQENFSAICGGNIVSFTAPIITASSATTDPVLNNPGFNGTTDVNIFNGTSGLLMAGESITVELTVVLNEDCIGSNSVSFSATNPLSNSVTSSASVPVNASTDTDNDTVSNANDIDDDNDTIPDLLEYNGLDPLDDDDGDLIPNYRDINFGADVNTDGIVDIFDFDFDGVANHLDTDTDNDGILDILEVGNETLDTNSNGQTNNPVGVNGLDNTVEDNDTSVATINYAIINSDIDSNPNYKDIDSDADGIVDNIEAQPTLAYTAPNNAVSDMGIDTAYPNGLEPQDIEGDTVPDYIDTNSDDDVRLDSVEGWDLNNDGIINGITEPSASGLDDDNDGLDNAFDNDDVAVNPTNGQVPTDFPNVDYNITEERDWREIMAVVVSIDSVSVDEGNSLEFRINLVTFNSFNNNTIPLVPVLSATDVVIDLTTTDGTDTTDVFDVAIAPFDYEGIDEIDDISIVIPANTNTFTLPFITAIVNSEEDTIFELDELFTLRGNVTSENTINTEAIGIGTILNDNDDAPDIWMNDSIANEGDDLVHSIMLSNQSSRPIEININTLNGITPTPAIASDDFISLNTTLRIEGTIDPDEEVLQPSFNITTRSDNLNEPDEEQLRVIGNVTLESVVGNQDLNKIGTIRDLDPEPLVVVTDDTVVEGEPLEFDISLINEDTGELMRNYLPINFNLISSDITTTAGQDYQPVFATGSIPALDSIYVQQIPTIDDRLNEETETMNLDVILTSTGVANTSNVIVALGTIKDNDIPNLFSPNGDGLSETFRIDGIEDFPNFKLVIVDRWGSEIYNYSNNGALSPQWWDGTYKGKPVTEGVYFYSLDFNDGVTPIKTGFIQLTR